MLRRANCCGANRENEEIELGMGTCCRFALYIVDKVISGLFLWYDMSAAACELPPHVGCGLLF